VLELCGGHGSLDLIFNSTLRRGVMSVILHSWILEFYVEFLEIVHVLMCMECELPFERGWRLEVLLGIVIGWFITFQG